MSLAAPAVFGSGHAVKRSRDGRLASDIVSRGEKPVKLAEKNALLIPNAPQIGLQSTLAIRHNFTNFVRWCRTEFSSVDGTAPSNVGENNSSYFSFQ